MGRWRHRLRNSGSVEVIHLLKGVEEGAAQRFAARITRAAYEPGALVLDFDDVSTDVFFVDAGGVRVTVRNAGGREVILGDLHAGAIFGEMAAIDEAPRSANITALHRSTVSRMSGQAFRDMAAEVPLVALRVMRVLTARIRLGNQRLLELATLPLKHRLHAELLREARPRPGAPELVISPPPLQHVLAARIGGRREAVSREIAEMLRTGRLRRTAGALVIVKADELRADLERMLRE
jgi:CRP/FNR family transcriptional regulator, cyclic AMP receptor protein